MPKFWGNYIHTYNMINMDYIAMYIILMSMGRGGEEENDRLTYIPKGITEQKWEIFI